MTKQDKIDALIITSCIFIYIPSKIYDFFSNQIDKRKKKEHKISYY